MEYVITITKDNKFLFRVKDLTKTEAKKVIDLLSKYLPMDCKIYVREDRWEHTGQDVTDKFVRK